MFRRARRIRLAAVGVNAVAVLSRRPTEHHLARPQDAVGHAARCFTRVVASSTVIVIELERYLATVALVSIAVAVALSANRYTACAPLRAARQSTGDLARRAMFRATSVLRTRRIHANPKRLVVVTTVGTKLLGRGAVFLRLSRRQGAAVDHRRARAHPRAPESERSEERQAPEGRPGPRRTAEARTTRRSSGRHFPKYSTRGAAWPPFPPTLPPMDGLRRDPHAYRTGVSRTRPLRTGANAPFLLSLAARRGRTSRLHPDRDSSP